MTTLLFAAVLACQIPAASSPQDVPRSFTKERCAAAGFRQCKTCNRPIAPGHPFAYNYRIEFDYPWSVRPCVGCAVGPPPGAAIDAGEPIAPPAARRERPATRR